MTTRGGQRTADAAHPPHHAHGADSSRSRLAIALALLAGFLVREVVGGILASSVALLADAGHMLVDVAAIALSLAAISIAARPAGGAMTFGFRRVEILSAQANGLTLLLLAVLILYEAIRRLVEPPDVAGTAVLVVALVGIAVNLAAVWVLRGADRSSLNVEGSFQHVLTDLYAFVATAVAGLVVVLTGLDRADAVAALVVAALMVRSGVRLVRASTRVFLEAAPENVDPDEIGAAMAGVPGVVEVHDLHVWEVTSGFPALSAHVLVLPGADCHDARRAIERMLAERFDLSHTTLQVDHARAGRLLGVERRG
jgi:cobalt-zinc-cadmium efflux system protein